MANDDDGKEAERFNAAVEAARTLFDWPGAAEFAAGFSAEWQKREDERQRALTERQ